MKELDKPVSLSYCDYIFDRILLVINLLIVDNPKGPIHDVSVGHMQSKQKPKDAFFYIKKTIEVVDSNNKRYRIIVEEV